MSQLTMQSLFEFQRLAGLGDAPPRRLYAGQTEFETDEEFFCRQRAKQRATQQATRDCSPGGKAFYKGAPVGSKMWNQCLAQRSQLYERRFIAECERAEELAVTQYYETQQRVMTAGGKVPWSGPRRRRRKADDEEGMKPFTGGKLPPSGVWPLPPVEGPPPTLQAGFTVQKQPTVILPLAPKPAGSAPPRAVAPVLNIPAARAFMPAPPLSMPGRVMSMPAPAAGMPTRQAVTLGPRVGMAAPAVAARTAGAPAARTAGARAGVALGALMNQSPPEPFLTVLKFTVGLFAGYWLMTDFLKKGRGQ